MAVMHSALALFNQLKVHREFGLYILVAKHNIPLTLYEGSKYVCLDIM